MGSAIQLRSAVALLGRFPALAGFDLDVAPGELVLVEGPNGAGKTSLLRVCAGLLPLSGGRGSVLGADLARRQRPSGVGFLGHATGLYDDLSALENVEFRARLARVAPSASAAALERVGIGGPLRGVPVGKLSAGQRRRVGLAALVAVAPTLWLLDEPHAGLDAASRAELDSILREATEAGGAVLLASHDVDHVGRVASRSVRIEGGRSVTANPSSVPRPESAGPADDYGSPERREVPDHVA